MPWVPESKANEAVVKVMIVLPIIYASEVVVSHVSREGQGLFSGREVLIFDAVTSKLLDELIEVI